MIKFIYIGFLFSLSSVVIAENLLETSTISLSVIRQEIDMVIKGPGSHVDISESANGIGLKIEKPYQNKYRIYAEVALIPYDDFTLAESIVSADYLLPLNSKISFFAGASLGLALQKYDDADLTDGSLGPVAGLQAGGVLDLSRQFLIEAGYRLRSTKLETEFTGATDTVATVDQLSEAYLALVLKF